MDACQVIAAGDDELLLMFILTNAKDKTPRRSTARLDLEQMNNNECRHYFRFGKTELPRLKEALRLPDKLVTPSGTIGSGIECLCILLRRLSYPNRLDDLSAFFGRTKTELSMLFNITLDHVYREFGHLLSTLQQDLLRPEKLREYADAIHEKGAPLTNCWGFIDGTARAIARPSRNQRQAYSGHKRVHALKFQSVMLPNGIVANMYGPLEGRRHDSGMLRESGLLEQIEQFMNGPNEQLYSLYGDPAYPLSPYLLRPFRGAQLTDDESSFNKAMSSCRESVEWGFCKIIQLFSFLDFRKNLKVLLQPVGKYYLVGAILTNCHTCLYDSQISSYFDLQPPTLEYLQG